MMCRFGVLEGSWVLISRGDRDPTQSYMVALQKVLNLYVRMNLVQHMHYRVYRFRVHEYLYLY